MRFNPISNRVASRRITRAANHLRQAEQQMAAASHASPDRFNRDRLRNFAVGLRNLNGPLARIANSLARGGVR
jgi:hypothetical protein